MKDISLVCFLIILALASLFYWSGTAAVPFHPDESTFLYLSSDLDTLLSRPAELAWQAGRPAETVQEAGRRRYWLLDAPAGRYLVGLSRRLAGEPPLPVDWDWSKTWAENEQAGALPSPRLLLAGRMGPAVLFPFSILLLFLAARKLTNDFTAWVSALLLAGSALVLLHTRRAMSEGALLFTAVLTLWSLAQAGRRPWLAAVPAALAAAAKHSLLALAPAGLLAILLPGDGMTAARRIRAAALYVGLLAACLYLFNPFLWEQPVQALQAAAQARRALVQAQVGDRPGQTLDTPSRRLVGLIGSLYITPPQTAEVGNYLAETRAVDDAYLSNPLHTLLRSLPAGTLVMLTGLFGFVSGIRKVWGAPAEQRGLALWWAAALLQALALLILVPLPWQRYYLPLVPLACFWTAYGLDTLLRPVQTRLAARFQPQVQRSHTN